MFSTIFLHTFSVTFRDRMSFQNATSELSNPPEKMLIWSRKKRTFHFCKSISSGAQYVIVHNKIGWRKILICQFCWGKWFWLSTLALFVVAGKRRHITSAHMVKRVEEIWYDCWAVSLIGPDGLLLVLPHRFAVPVSVFQLGLQRSK